MVKVNQEDCIGCGSCESICPEVFEMKEGKAHVKPNANPPKNRLKEAIESCPVDAIK